MAVCRCHEKKEWMRWHVTQSALLDGRSMNMLQKIYNAGPSSIKACTSRGPGGIQTSYGVIEHISPQSIYPKVCWKQDGVSNDTSALSDVAFRPDRVKPPYRKRTRDGVYVGSQPSTEIKQAVHPMVWNPDTNMPAQCRFMHCLLRHQRKLIKEA